MYEIEITTNGRRKPKTNFRMRNIRLWASVVKFNPEFDIVVTQIKFSYKMYLNKNDKINVDPRADPYTHVKQENRSIIDHWHSY